MVWLRPESVEDQHVQSALQQFNSAHLFSLIAFTHSISLLSIIDIKVCRLLSNVNTSGWTGGLLPVAIVEVRVKFRRLSARTCIKEEQAGAQDPSLGAAKNSAWNLHYQPPHPNPAFPGSLQLFLALGFCLRGRVRGLPV